MANAHTMDTAKIIAPVKGSRMHRFKRALRKNYAYYIMFIIPFFHFLIFQYIPMLGNIIAFRRFSFRSPFTAFFGAEWIGFEMFELFLTSPQFWGVFLNTVILSAYGLIFAYPVPIIFALMLNELRNGPFKKFVQTCSYLPHFISMVVAVGMVIQILSPHGGIVNTVRNFFGLESIFFMQMPEWFRTIYISSGIWQSMGMSAILFIAALAGVDPELYEAAVLDGAGKLKQTWHVTLPGIAPAIVITLIFNIGGMLGNNVERILLMYNPLTMPVADVIGTFVFRVGLASPNPAFSFATAIGLFNSVIGLGLVMFANWFARRVSEISLW